MTHAANPCRITTFDSDLGFMAMVGRDGVLLQLVFGHGGQRQAMAALDPQLTAGATHADWSRPLVERLLAYASGDPVDFRDVEVDPGPLGPFHRSVVEQCRAIPYGRTLTYGQLAARAGSPGAARAVGRAMAANRLPIVVPCHRVVAADGRLGGFSAPGGCSMKRRLLNMEARTHAACSANG